MEPESRGGSATLALPLSTGATHPEPGGSAEALLSAMERPAVVLLNANGSVRRWYHGAERLYGWTAPEALGRPITWLAANGSKDSALLRDELAAVLLSGSGEREEQRRRKDGSVMWVLVRKIADMAQGVIWEISEPREKTGVVPGLSPTDLEMLTGAEVLIFDGDGRLRESRVSGSAASLSEKTVDAARSLALQVLRVGVAREVTDPESGFWLRACRLAIDTGSVALVLARTATGVAAAERRRLSELCRRLLDAQEAERRRLARELHDDLCQDLTGMLYSLDATAGSPQPLRAEIAALLAKARQISQGLRPGVLDDVGLSAALRWLADEHRRRYPVTIELKLPEDGTRWPEELETALFRIAQEALSNAARHSGAGRIEMVLNESQGELSMRITDDGKGFEVEMAPAGGTGLASMRERSLLLGGRFELSSTPGSGARIAVRLPLLRERES